MKCYKILNRISSSLKIGINLIQKLINFHLGSMIAIINCRNHCHFIPSLSRCSLITTTFVMTLITTNNHNIWVYNFSIVRNLVLNCMSYYQILRIYYQLRYRLLLIQYRMVRLYNECVDSHFYHKFIFSIKTHTTDRP